MVLSEEDAENLIAVCGANKCRLPVIFGGNKPLTISAPCCKLIRVNKSPLWFNAGNDLKQPTIKYNSLMLRIQHLKRGARVKYHFSQALVIVHFGLKQLSLH